MNSGDEKKIVSNDSMSDTNSSVEKIDNTVDFQQDNIVVDDGLISVNQAQQSANTGADNVPPEEENSDEKTASLDNALERMKEKADENWDKYLRLNAEMENLTRRKDKQIEDAHKYAIKGFAESLLPVIDSLEMGLSAEGDIDSIREGMSLTLKQFSSVMEKFDLVAISPEGEKFNPEFHQAMSMQPSAEHETNDVVLVMQKGYTLNGRLVRPAMVMVCKN